MDDAPRRELLCRAYRLFNQRDIDALLATMTDDVEWPDVANGAVLRGPDAIRRYWQAQFLATNPQVEPTDLIDVGDEIVVVVDQRIVDLRGQPVTAPAVVFHRYGFAGDLVCRMQVFIDRDEALASP